MRHKLLVAACAASICTLAAAAGPFDPIKGRMKEGLYEYKTTMDMGAMPGMPAGMGKQQHTFQHCLTARDIEEGRMGEAGGKDQMPKGCEVRNFKMSGSTASYTTVCKGEMDMTSDTVMTFTDNGYRMDMKTAMKDGGETMRMNQQMEGRYLGPCKK